MSDVVLVTGANKGLGLAVCKQLVSKGYRVILTARNSEKGKSAVKQLSQAGAKISFFNLDLNDPNSFEACRIYIEQEFGRLDVLVNNAAIHYDMGNSVLNPNWTMVQEAMQTNLLHTWKLTTKLLPVMEKSAHGRIVNVSSSAGAITGMGGGTPAYAISKSGLNVLTIKLAHALATRNIIVNAVCPGWVRTDMGGDQAPRSVEEGAASIIWAATLPPGGPSGGFYRDGKEIPW